MNRPLVDVHSHLYLPTYVRYLERRAAPPWIRWCDGVPRFQLFPGDVGVEVTAEFTGVAAKLAFMDRTGITHSVLSPGNPWLDLDGGPASRSLARAVNAEMVAAVRAAPSSLSGMALLPNDDVQSAVAEVEAVAAAGQLVGLAVGTTVAGHGLDDPALDPFWTAVDRSGLPVFVHPRSGLIPEATRGYGQALTLALSFPVETTVAVARLVLSGAFDRHPGLRLVAAHGGGALPYLAGRLRRAVQADESAGGDPGALAERAPGLYVDSVLFSAPALALCVDVLGAGRVLFGTDHPFPIAEPTSGVSDLAAVLVGDAYERVAHANAEALFGPAVVPAG